MALDIFQKFATDESLENNGTWFEIGGGARILVARAGNSAYAKMLTKEYERHRQVLEVNDNIADARSQQIMVDVMASTILLDWEGLAFKGETIGYSLENAKKLLAIKDFRRLVAERSDNMEAYLAKEEAAQGEA